MMCNVYSENPVLKGARSERDLKDIALYCSFAQNVPTGPMSAAPSHEAMCQAPYGYRTLANAYQFNAGPFNMSLGMGNGPLNFQYYGAKKDNNVKKLLKK
jgi:hypothetical protein